MDLGNALIAMLSAVAVAGIGYASTRLTSSTQKKTAEVEARGPDWDRFVERVEKHNAETRAELNGRIDRLQNKVQRLEDKLDEKDRVIREKDELIAIKDRKYRQALSYALQWRRKYPRDPLVDLAPADLREDLPSYWPRDVPEV